MVIEGSLCRHRLTSWLPKDSSLLDSAADFLRVSLSGAFCAALPSCRAARPDGFLPAPAESGSVDSTADASAMDGVAVVVEDPLLLLLRLND